MVNITVTQSTTVNGSTIFTASPSWIQLGMEDAYGIDTIQLTVPDAWAGMVIGVTFAPVDSTTFSRTTVNNALAVDSTISGASGVLMIDATDGSTYHAYTQDVQYQVVSHIVPAGDRGMTQTEYDDLVALYNSTLASASVSTVGNVVTITCNDKTSGTTSGTVSSASASVTQAADGTITITCQTGNGTPTTATLAVDSTPTIGSNNVVNSNGVAVALNGKQSTLTFDSTPTAGSNNPVTSGGMYISQVEQTAAINQTVANALQGTLTGTATRADDVSPLAHNLAWTQYGQSVQDGTPTPSAPVAITGKTAGFKVAQRNLFHISMPHTISSNTYLYTMQLLPNTKYTLSSNVPSSAPASLYFNGESTSSNGTWLGTPRTITTDSTGIAKVYVRYDSTLGGYNLYALVLAGTYYIQLELGSTATTYSPYVAPVTEVITDASGNPITLQGIPLTVSTSVTAGLLYISPTRPTPIQYAFWYDSVNSIGYCSYDGATWANVYIVIIGSVYYYADGINGNNAKVTYNIYKKIFSSADDLQYISIFNGYYLSQNCIPSLGLCSHCVMGNSLSTPNISVVNGAIRFYGWATLYPTVAEIKAFFDQQIAAGMPVTVYYALKTPTASSVILTPSTVAANTPTTTVLASAYTKTTYNRDLNSAISKLTSAIVALGGNV